MKRTLLFVFACFLSLSLSAQTQLFLEDFESGGGSFSLNTTDLGGTASGENPWILNDIYAGGSGSFICFSTPIPFTVPPAPTQPAGITNSPTSFHLHVTPQIAIDAGGSLPAASYVVADGFCIFGGESTFSAMNSDISTVGHDSVTFDYWWTCGGSTLYYGELYYSTDGGNNWTAVTNPLNNTTQWRGQNSWVNTIVTDPAWGNQAMLRFGVRFLSPSAGTGSEVDPGYAVDDIEITGYTASGGGCVGVVDTSVTTANTTLTSGETGATSYQWLDCDNGMSPIAGATSQMYTATANGNYAVEVTANGCTDTSACHAIVGIGIVENSFGDDFSYFPNPVDEDLYINLGGTYENLTIAVYNTQGQLISRETATATNQLQLPFSDMASGPYVIQVMSEQESAVIRVVKK